MHFNTPASPTWLVLFAHLTHAHVRLEQPVPYGTATLNTNPLLVDGSDWPCKQRAGVYEITQWNIMPINSPQTISFQGQATHGGGSCQISLTRDTPPTADSVFKVIKSIEGGCPSTNPGNVGTDPFGYGADNFTFTIPDVIVPANYTLAWTWFNKIGNREMYMNCAPVTVTPSSSKKRHRRRGIVEQRTDAMDSLPDMFRANSGNGYSTAPSGTVLAIPAENLGQVVQRIGSDSLTPPVGTCGGTDVPAVRQDQIAITSSVSSVFTSAAIPAATTSSVVPLASQAPPASAMPSESPIANPSVSGVTTGTCATPGKSVCSPDGTAWGDCMENYQVIYQPVSVGTKCDIALGVEVPATKG